MAEPRSVSRLIGRLREGDDRAMEPLWELYFPKLVELARRKLRGRPARLADEEDVALSALDSFCRRAKGGKFPDLEDRGSLWRLLVTITARKAVKVVRKETREKRGGGKVQNEGALQSDDAASQAGLDRFAGPELTPEFAAQVGEECERLLGQLDGEHRQIALWKLEGCSNEEIAAQLGCVGRTVERKLRVIRALWSAGDSADVQGEA